jgi:hypothetical protein
MTVQPRVHPVASCVRSIDLESAAAGSDRKSLKQVQHLFAYVKRTLCFPLFFSDYLRITTVLYNFR